MPPSDQTQQPAVMKRYQPLVAAWHSLYKVTPEYVSSDVRLDQHNVVSWSACQHCGHTWDNTRHQSSTHLSRIQPFIFISRETISGLRLEWISTVWLDTGWTRTCWSLSRRGNVSQSAATSRESIERCDWRLLVLVLELNRKKSQPVTSRVDLQVPWRHGSRHRCVFHDRHLTTN